MRASKRSLFFKCPSSAIEAPLSYAVAEQIANVGTIAHAGLARYIDAGEVDYNKLIADCDVRDIDRDEVQALVEKGILIWNRIKPDGDDVIIDVESNLSPFFGMTGTPDVRWVDGETANIVDWKMGREQRDCYHQLAQYAFLYRASLIMGGVWTEAHRVNTQVHWVRLGRREVRVFDDAALDSWLEYMGDRETEIGKTYAPGDHCGFCPHVATCKPRTDWLQSSVNALSEQTETAVTPDVLGKLYDRSKALKRALEAYDKILSDTLDSGQIVPLPDGRWLERDYRKVRQLEPVSAMAELTALGVTEDEMSDIVKTRISATGFDKLVRSKVKRGKGKATIDAITQRMSDSNSLTYRQDKTIVTKGEVNDD